MSRRSKPDRKARKPGLFEIKVMTPPPASLGIYALPPNTHNGEEVCFSMLKPVHHTKVSAVDCTCSFA